MLPFRDFTGRRFHWACEAPAFLAAVLALPRAPTRWFFWLVLFLTPADGSMGTVATRMRGVAASGCRWL